MVFESIVADVLNRFVGEYVENLDKKQLKIGIWGGDVVLNNLVLKQSALKELDLPVSALYGHLGKLVLKIPWKNLYSAPVEAIVDKLYILAVPNTDIKYNAEKEDKASFEAKKAELLRIEQAKKSEEDKETKSIADKTFAEKLTTQIVNNVQIKISDIHIRYEDTTTTGFPFAFGITLSNLCVHTTDENWIQTLVSESVTKIYKVAQMEMLSVYMNCNTKLFQNAPQENYLRLFEENIASKTKQPSNYHYIFGPISSGARLVMTPNPEVGDAPFTTPKIKLSLQMETLSIGITRIQYQNLMQAVEAMGRMMRAMPYRKFRPYGAYYKGNYKLWWQFAYTCIIETVIRRRKENWSWEHMLTHRKYLKLYEEIYRQKLTMKKITPDIIEKCDELEKILDLQNLVIVRQKVELEVEKQGKLKEAEPKQGWLSSWWSGSKKTDEEEKQADIKKQFEAAMTPQEKAKLFKAIGYQENAVPTELPENYVAQCFEFDLNSLEISIKSEMVESSSNISSKLPLETILLLQLRNVGCKFQQRPSAPAMKLDLRLQELSVQGVKQGEILPLMVYSQLDSSNTLLEVMFETNPIDKLCDQRVVLGSRPIQIVYDAQTIIQLAKVFQTPKSDTISQLTDAAAERLVNIKERSAVGLQYAISKHPRLELNISLMPTYIIIPHSGLFTKNASVLVLSLGSLLMTTEPRPLDQKDVRTMFEEGASQEEILHEMIRQSYDKFSLELRDVQGIVATYDEDWRTNLEANIVTTMHILEPTSFKIQAHLCVLSDDPRLPKVKIFGELPSINVAVTEQRVFEVLKIATSIPFPENEELKPAPMNKETSIFNSSLSLITKYLDDKQKENSKQVVSSDTLRLDDTVDEVVQFTDLEINFVLNACSLTIFKAACTNTSSTDTFATPTGELAESPLDAEIAQKTVAFDVPYFVSSQTKILTCNVRQLEMTVVQRTYDLKVALKLGAVMLDQFRIKNEREKVLNVINTPKYVDNDEFLFTVDYTNCKKNSPEFAMKYESVEQEVGIKFSTIVLTLNEECLNELISMANDFQNKMDLIVNAKPRDRVATIHEEETKTKQILTAAKEKLPTILEDGPVSFVSSKDTKKQTSIVDSIKIRVHAVMEDVTVELQNAKRPIGVLEVQNLDCSAIMKTSYTEINMKLQDILLQDKNPASIHRNILTIIGDNAIKVQVILYNLEATSEYNSDNMKIDVEMGCAKIVFMNWFVTSVLNFLDNFQAAQQKIKDAGAAVAEAAKQNVVEAYTQATRMKLGVSLNAPIIIIPVDSQSLQAIAMDFGYLTISNTIKDVPTSHDNNKAVIDKMKVELKDMKLSKVNVFHSEENIGEDTMDRIGSEDMMYGLIPDSNILNPTSFTLSIKRNLSSSWYKDEPEMDISGRLKAVEVNCITSDYSVILQILSKNMTEGQNEIKKPVKVDKPAMSPVQDDAKESWISAAKKVSVKPFGIELGQIKDKNDQLEKVKEQISTFLRFSFQIDSIKLKIFTSPGNGLASFGIYFLSLKGQKLSDGSLSTSIALCDVLIDDTRPGRENKLTRMMERRGGESFDETDASVIPASTMVDITLSMMENDITTEMKISSFNLILSLDFIMKVLEFLQPQELQEKKAQAEIVAAESRSRKSSTSIATQPDDKSTIKVRLKIEQPDIILVERMDDVNCYALILNNEIDLKVRILPEKMIIDGELRDLCFYYCEFNPARRNLTKHYVIHPCQLSLFGSTPEGKGLFINLKSTEINMSVSPAIIELINNVLATLQTKETAVLEETKKVMDYSDLWQVQDFDENDFWFIKAEVAEDAINMEETLSIASLTRIDVKEEKCIIEIPKISLIIETGTGFNTIPMLYIETKFDASVDNWSSKLAISSTLCLNMSYYNQTLALWEYMIEPNVIEKLDGQIEYSPWELQFVMYIDNHEEDPTKEPTTVINVKSKEILEMTVTKRCLEALQTLGNAFSVAMKREGIAAAETVAPYIVRNDTGLDIKVDFIHSDFNIHPSHIEDRKSEDLVAIENSADGVIKSCLILPGGKLNLEPKVNDVGVILPASLEDGKNIKKKFLKVVIGDTDKEIFLPVYKSDRRYFPIFRNTNQEAWAIISDVRIEFGSTVVTIRGIVQVYNHFTMPIYVHQRANDEFEYVGEVKPGSYLNVPLLYTYAPIKELHFAMNGYYASSQGIGWKEQPNNLELIKLLQCYPVKTFEPFYINAVRERHEVYYEVTSKYTMMSACYEIHLKPPLSLRNALPIGLTLSVAGCSVSRETLATSAESISNTSTVIGEDYLDYGEKLLRPGELLHLPTVKTAGSTKTGENPSYVVARLVDYLEKDWSCTTEIPSSPPEFQVWTFNSYDSVEQMSIQLGVRYENQSDGLMLTIYCPFWMINKTGLMLSYRANDENTNLLYHPPDYEGPILFSFREKAFFGKKKAAVRVDSGEWSEKFSLDVAGSSGVVSCEANDMIYQIGIQNTLTNNSLTKQIVLMPYFVLINRADFDIEVQEDQRPADPWITVKSNDCVPLWPKTAENRMLKVKSCDSEEVTAPFKYTDVQCTLLQLKNKYGGISVDVHVTEGAIYVTFMGYFPGDAPALIINHTDEDFSFWEKGNINSRVLRPKQKMLYTWLNPAGDRAIMWNNGSKETIENDLRRDGINQIVSHDSGKEVFWVSFLNGTQRVLLLTNDESIADSVQSANQLDQITQEIILEIHGVGLSLVNNQKQFDLMYIGIASSGVIWEECKKSGRFKQMKIQETIDMERLYQQYVAHTKVNHAKKYFLENVHLEVDFDEMIIKKSTNRKIRRAFYPGFWIEMKSSSHQMQFHAKINRIQIDNQLTDCIFPVVLAPIPPPKSVAATTEFKPFIEMSVVQRIIPHSNVKQFKYLRMLIQEFHIKVDLPFVNEIFEMISSETTEAEAKKLFAQDLELQKQPLFAHVTVQSQQEVKHFYDNLHLGPLKIHVSFSMAGSESKALPAILSTILQGVGVTLTDINDVVFRLAFFERDYQFLTQRQLVSECVSHYVGQAVKQLYVLVLGLDVIGNPYGLVIGFTTGVGDLFYEPFQGAIQGPGEFAEGLVLGVRSLFGHTVGGAAGAVSKITGAMGKGLAALTFDKDYQKKRRDAMNKKPANLQEGIARSGKGLVMGVYDGFTGVITKPLSGAKNEGVGGFFKGLGKGAVGLVARPTAGIVDFASGTFDSVKRATEMSDETTRLRPPRLLHTDGIVRPYNRKEAEGYKMLREIDKGKFAATDTFVWYEVLLVNKDIMVLTNYRVIYGVKNEIFGGWQTEWSYKWEEVDQVRLHGAGVELIMKNEPGKNKFMKMFGQSDLNRKIILVDIEERMPRLVELMNNLRVKAG